MLATIDLFEGGRLSLPDFLHSNWAEIQDLKSPCPDDLAELEQLWTELEIIYAMAVAEGPWAPDDEQKAAVARAIGDMKALLASR
jgi:hypothetical protein